MDVLSARELGQNGLIIMPKVKGALLPGKTWNGLCMTVTVENGSPDIYTNIVLIKIHRSCVEFYDDAGGYCVIDFEKERAQYVENNSVTDKDFIIGVSIYSDYQAEKRGEETVYQFDESDEWCILNYDEDTEVYHYAKYHGEAEAYEALSFIGENTLVVVKDYSDDYGELGRTVSAWRKEILPYLQIEEK